MHAPHLNSELRLLLSEALHYIPATRPDLTSRIEAAIRADIVEMSTRVDAGWERVPGGFRWSQVEVAQ